MAKDSEKCSTHSFRITEPYAGRDAFDGFRAPLDSWAGRFDTKTFDRFGWSLSGFGDKDATELSGTDGGDAG